ncbi:MAG: glycosyltransferase [Anaerolineae bacterium]|nr:glycosyltransferase [Anaerolineae bacterium]
MNILHLYKDYPPVLGGIENHIKGLAEAQAQRGHQVTVLVTGLDHHTRGSVENGVRVIRAARLAQVASTPLSLSLPRLLRRQRPDITHLHFPYPLGEVSQWLLGRARRTVLSYHSDVVRQAFILRLYAPLLRCVLRRVDRIIAATPQYRDSSRFLQPYRDKCVLIPYGIDLHRFQEADAALVAAIRQRHGSAASGEPGPLLLFVGRLRYYKGLSYLIQAMAHVPATLLVVGSGPMEREWRQLAAATGVADRVHFLGDVEDAALPAYYHAADLFVLPASQRSEAFGIVLVEAMASGTPLISTELGTGTSYVNRHGETGLVVPPRDPQALAAAINELLADDERRQAMGHAARARAEAEFSLPAMVERVLEVYEGVLQTRDQ